MKTRAPVISNDTRQSEVVIHTHVIQHFRNLNVTINDIAPAYANNINGADYDDLILNEPITEEEIIAASKKLKNSKSPGDDNIANEYI